MKKPDQDLTGINRSRLCVRDPFILPDKATQTYVTDGPWLYRTRTGTRLMIWSSFGAGGYTTGLAVSASGTAHGPWNQVLEPLFADDGGHAMMFKRFDGQLMLALHQPNRSPDERARLFARPLGF